MIEQALVAHLTGYADLSDLIGNRVDPVSLALKSRLPAITYQRISNRPTKHRSSRLTTFSRPRYQFDVWGRTHLEAVTVRDVFKRAMADFVRDSNPRVDVALLQDDRDAFESEPDRWRAILDYYIWHTET